MNTFIHSIRRTNQRTFVWQWRQWVDLHRKQSGAVVDCSILDPDELKADFFLEEVKKFPTTDLPDMRPACSSQIQSTKCGQTWTTSWTFFSGRPWFYLANILSPNLSPISTISSRFPYANRETVLNEIRQRFGVAKLQSLVCFRIVCKHSSMRLRTLAEEYFGSVHVAVEGSHHGCSPIHRTLRFTSWNIQR